MARKFLANLILEVLSLLVILTEARSASRLFLHLGAVFTHFFARFGFDALSAV